MKKFMNTQFNLNNLGDELELFGWIAKKRDLGSVVFIDLRDRSGIMQLFIKDQELIEKQKSFKNEAVIRVRGTLEKRDTPNPKILTGEVELLVKEIDLINNALDLPFEITDETTALEDTRLKYRYLDLRRKTIQDNLIIRHKTSLITRNFLSSLGFIEIETPILCKSTPEGARDYLVPSRIFQGKFYALPQSPQIYKQLLMVGGIEKYFQIARCFRDEDLRADRQPEFTQIDLEMSFAEEKDILEVVEALMREIFIKIKDYQIDEFPVISYDEAINNYGTDKPDLRFEILIQDLTAIFKDTKIETFKEKEINALVINEASFFSRKDLDELSEYVKRYGAKYLAYLKYENDEYSGSLAKNLSNDEKDELKRTLNLQNNDLILIVADKKEIVKTALGALRVKLAKRLNLLDSSVYKFAWIKDFPMFDYDAETDSYSPAHHPFTSPKQEDAENLLSDKKNCRARAYDLVINGYEILSGSVRIHDAKLQAKVFEAIGMSPEEAEDKFGFFMNAFKYGTPPHAGVGIGFERVIMLLCETENIKDVVAFPKTSTAYDLMSSAPNAVDEKQLEDLGIKLTNK